MVADWKRSPSETRRGSWLATGLAALLLIACGGDDPEVDASTPEALAESLGCENVSELDSLLAPIRGRGATAGVSCDVDGETIHIFARAPIEDPDAVGWGQGGTEENIRRLLGADVVDASCELAVWISDDVFVVGTSADQLSGLGVPGDEPIPISPTVSYLDTCAIDEL